MKPTLVILAAGVGSRYGGVKQMDKIGPSGESIIDYSVFDAIRAGFGKVVFVLNPKIIDDFKAIFEPRLAGKIKTEYILQELHNIPEGIEFNHERTKPWGTGHAVLVAEQFVHEPFAVINADDFYGREAFHVLADFLTDPIRQQNEYALVGYKLSNTLSENGSVSRGICQSENGCLTDVVERTSIVRKEEGIVFEEAGTEYPLKEDDIVSMNFWGFTPLFFSQLKRDFSKFILENAHQLKAEFYIPLVANNLINSGESSFRTLTSNDQWFGVTYQEDKPVTIQRVAELVEKGYYPGDLWG
ncbi:MAG: nucleotidyltransferase [Bacteroidetes bacterium HGW-Bacteroidetes-16]|jgi:dTDP-glucose pyrophosphorylase|nr:MAG: nucleotidyltransferase [Bacteroidetes bacterium HGW-Bacteroidetes-16]